VVAADDVELGGLVLVLLVVALPRITS